MFKKTPYDFFNHNCCKLNSFSKLFHLHVTNETIYTRQRLPHLEVRFKNLIQDRLIVSAKSNIGSCSLKL